MLLSPPLAPWRATLELLFASSMWGFGFIATRWGLEGLSPLYLGTARFLLASVIGYGLILSRSSLRTLPQKKVFMTAMVPGLLLGISLALQTAGVKYTSVTRCSFITVLYVLIVPVLDSWLFRAPFRWLYAITISLALVGTALLCQLKGGDWGNWGDFLTLICAFTSAGHIMSIAHAAGEVRSPFAFNIFQSVWAMLPVLAGAIFFEAFPSTPVPVIAWTGIVILAIVSTLIAFLIQVRAQRVLSPSTVSMICLLESPFATLFAVWIFGETLSLGQLVGCGLILSAAVITIYYSVPRRIPIEPTS